MALYKTDFSEYPVAAQPSDWTERWATTYGNSAVEAVSDGIGGKSLKVTDTTASHYGLSWDDCGTPGDVEILVREKRKSNPANCLYTFARGSGTTSRGFYCVTRVASQWELYKNVASSYTGLGAVAKCEAYQWVWVRFRLQGTSLKVKIWYDGDQEPPAWDIEVTDSSLASGWVAVGGNAVANAHFDWFAAETASGSWPIVAPWEIKDISLDLSVYGQRLADLGSYLRAHDGVELHDLHAELSTWGLVEEDFLSWLAAYYELTDSFPTNLSTWATGYKNLAGYYDVKGQKLESVTAFLYAAKEMFKDLATYLSVTNGSIFKDLATYLSAVDGILLRDVAMSLQAIGAAPAFRSVTAQRINSVIHEVV